MAVVIETTIGDITVDLYLDDRPRTCLNFIKLCKIKYYNFSLFHKIQRNFIAQTGDPTGTGRGGESIFSCLYGEQARYFESESKPRIKHKKLGSLSMVNNGSNMNGSQFFITLGEDLTYLDEEHTVFGEVTEGFEILVKLNDTICDNKDRPYQDIRITHTVILHDPYDDPPSLDIPPSSPAPTKEILASEYVGADEDLDDNKGRSIEEIEEEIKDKEAKARATILEMVGDIPDAEVKPPENVLFVCKLNPVTTDEDLEIIFSRFGTIKSCEVIKDKKTDESLQYAFIEFEREEDCENAYFKMDNVLIDDRRIHVDFSQSVAKLKFDKNNRPIIEKQNSNKETFVIKDNSKKTKQYDMIFESDEDQPVVDKKQKSENSSKRRPSSSRDKYRTRSPSRHSRTKSPSRYSRTKSPSRRSRSRSLSRHSRSKSPSRHLKTKTASQHSRTKSPSRYSTTKSPLQRSVSNSPSQRSRTKSPSHRSSKSSYHDSTPRPKHKKHKARSPSPEYKLKKHHSSKHKKHHRRS